jgi:CDP-diacylglycerol--glycerol-3-phosphate 3-phosphatidyltransferase
MADGAVARLTDMETRTGATLDIMCDRISAAVFYVGFAWYDPSMVVPVGIYLAEFMVIDMYLSLAFLAWPVSSPNYFYLINRRIWLWNWSKPGKALNSALFAVFMVWTRDAWVAGVIACGLLGIKLMSLGWMMQLGLPVPSGCVKIVDGDQNSANAAL